MSRLVILRHGNTFGTGEPPRRIGARTDLPLTEEGRAQARRVGRYFAALGWRFSEIRTAPLARTRETAALVAAALPDAPPLTVDEGLAEIDHGPDEGLSEAAVLARLGAAAIEAWDRARIVPPGWQVDPGRRIAWWRARLAEPAGDRLFVTSNGAARFALADLPPPPSLKLRTAAWGEIVTDGTATRLVAWDARPPD
ncbi:MAG: histidine phosphatase family protein [Sphingomonas fennica]